MDKNITEEEELPEFMRDEAKTLEYWVGKEMSNPAAMARLASNLMQKANEDGGQSLKILKEISENLKFKQEKKQIISDEQLETIITLSADRIRQRAGSASQS